MADRKVQAFDDQVQGKSVAATRLADLLDEILATAWRGSQLKAEYVAVSIGISSTAMSKYRSGTLPLPLEVAAAIDNFLGDHRLLAEMAAIEGLVYIVPEEAST